jgi:P-type Cu+ transporter
MYSSLPNPRKELPMESVSPTVESRVRVEGMDCATCATKIETALAHLSGLSTASVNYAAQRLTLQTSDPAVLDVALATIRKLGYHPTLLPHDRRAPAGEARTTMPRGGTAARRA